jgi:hypothetical protein
VLERSTLRHILGTQVLIVNNNRKDYHFANVPCTKQVIRKNILGGSHPELHTDGRITRKKPLTRTDVGAVVDKTVERTFDCVLPIACSNGSCKMDVASTAVLSTLLSVNRNQRFRRHLHRRQDAAADQNLSRRSLSQCRTRAKSVVSSIDRRILCF